MSDVSFDVLEALDGLKSAGFSDTQARALADTLQSVAAARHADLVTKGDLRAEIADLRTELLKAMADQLKWTIATLVLLTGILFGAKKLL